MFREMTIMAALITLIAFAAGCKSLDNKITKVEHTKGIVAVQTTSDERTAMIQPKKHEKIKSSLVSTTQELKRHPDDVPLLITQAQLRLARGELDEAEKICKKALRLDLKNKTARIILAQVALRKGNSDLANIILQGLGGAKLKDSNVLNMLALIEYQNGEMLSAKHLFKRAIKLNPSDVAARMNLGVLLLKYRQLAAASTQFERVLRTMPGHIDAKLHLGIIKAARGDRAAAEDIYEGVLAQDPKNPIALYNLAVLQKNEQDYSDAISNLKMYLKSGKISSTKTDQVFALIDEIQKRQAAEGSRVSDEEIQELAAGVTELEEEKSVKRVAKVPAKTQKVVRKKPAAAPKKVVAEKKPEPVEEVEEELDDVSSLEAELMK